MSASTHRRKTALTVIFAILSVIYVMPVVLVLINSFKANSFVNTETFRLPTAESFVGLQNYIKGMPQASFADESLCFPHHTISCARWRASAAPDFPRVSTGYTIFSRQAA